MKTKEFNEESKEYKLLKRLTSVRIFGLEVDFSNCRKILSRYNLHRRGLKGSDITSCDIKSAIIRDFTKLLIIGVVSITYLIGMLKFCVYNVIVNFHTAEARNTLIAEATVITIVVLGFSFYKIYLVLRDKNINLNITHNKVTETISESVDMIREKYCVKYDVKVDQRYNPDESL